MIFGTKQSSWIKYHSGDFNKGTCGYICAVSASCWGSCLLVTFFTTFLYHIWKGKCNFVFLCCDWYPYNSSDLSFYCSKCYLLGYLHNNLLNCHLGIAHSDYFKWKHWLMSVFTSASLWGRLGIALSSRSASPLQNKVFCCQIDFPHC